MASIVTRTINSEVDQRISLLNEEMGRTISIGSNWKKIRIGIRPSINGNTSLGTTLPFYFGICSGTNRMYGDVNTQHFVGIRSGSASWSASATMHTVGNVEKVVKVGEIATATIFTPSSNMGIPVATSRRGQLFLEFTKGDSQNPTSWTMNFDSYASGNSSDVTQANFITSMQAAYGTVNATSGLDNITLTVDEATNGYLDTLCFGWSNSSLSIELSDFAYSRLE